MILQANISANDVLHNCYNLTVLNLISCIILWILSPVELFHARRHRTGCIPWTGLSGMKIVLTILLIVCNLVRVCNVSNVVSESILLIFTMILVLGLIKINRSLGSRISPILSFFWIIQTICNSLTYTLEIEDVQADRINSSQFVEFVVNLVQLPLVAGELVLSVFNDAHPTVKSVSQQKKNPEGEATILSKLFFSWIHSFIIQREFFDYSTISNILNWQDKLHYITTHLCIYRDQSNQLFRFYPTHLMKTIFEWKRQQNYLNFDLKGVRTWNISLIKLFSNTLGLDYILAGLLQVISDLLIWSNPFFISFVLMLNWKHPGCWCAYIVTTLWFISYLIQRLLRCQSEYFLSTIVMRAKGAVICIIYEKVLRSFAVSTSQLTNQEIKRLITEDANNIKNIFQIVPSIVSLPFHLIIALCFMYAYVGKTTLICVLVLIIMLTVTAMINTKVRLHQKNTNVNNGKLPSARLMKKILRGLKTIKLLAWEFPFLNLVENARLEEMTQSHHLFYWSNLEQWIQFSMPFIMQVAIVITYYSFETLPARPPHIILIAFAAINILCSQIQDSAEFFHTLFQGVNSLKNFKSFTLIAELDEEATSLHEDNDKYSLVIQNGRFSTCPGQPPVLRNINLKVKIGEFVALSGPKHSGKVSLISSILGEMEKIRGHLSVQGRVAYVPKIPWIFNASIKDNILIGHLPNDFFYEIVIQHCQLNDLIKSLPLGDLTSSEVVNLNLQQMHQISLARAVYSNADIYLMEDFLSDLDDQFAQTMYENLLGSDGLLRDKTRILITNNTSFLNAVDLVVVMHKGFISFVGPHSEAFSYLDNEKKVVYQEKVVCEQKFIDDKSPVRNNRWLHPRRLKDRIQFYIHSGGKWNWCLWSILLATGIVLLVVSQLSLELWIDDMSYSTPEEPQNDLLILIHMLTTLFCMVVLYVNEFVIYNVVETSSHALNSSILETIFQLPLTFIQDFPIRWTYIENIFQDLKIADYIFPFAISQSLILTGSVFAILIIAAVFQPFSCIVAVIFFCIFIYVLNIYKRVHHCLSKQENESWKSILSHVNQTLEGLTSIRAFKRQKEFQRELENLLDISNTYNYATVIINQWMRVRMGILVSIFTLCIFIGCLVDEVSSATLGVAVIFSLKLGNILEDLVFMLSTMDIACESLTQLQNCCLLPREAPWICQTPLTLMWPTLGGIKFKAYVSCQRDKLDLLLRGITCEFLPGEKIGIVGTQIETNAIVEALFRLTEGLAGVISVDGVDTNTLGLHQLRSEIGIVSMESSAILPGTIRFNLDPNQQHTNEEVWKALTVTKLADFVRSLPLALHDQIQDDDIFNTPYGQGLLSCARVQLRNNRIVVLDITLPNMDQSVVETVWSTFENSTLIILSLDLDRVMNCDRVIILDRGVVRSFDKPQAIKI